MSAGVEGESGGGVCLYSGAVSLVGRCTACEGEWEGVLVWIVEIHDTSIKAIVQSKPPLNMTTCTHGNAERNISITHSTRRYILP